MPAGSYSVLPGLGDQLKLCSKHGGNKRIDLGADYMALGQGVELLKFSELAGGAGTPLSPCFRTARICGSVNFDFLVPVSVDNQR